MTSVPPTKPKTKAHDINVHLVLTPFFAHAHKQWNIRQQFILTKAAHLKHRVCYHFWAGRRKKAAIPQPPCYTHIVIACMHAWVEFHDSHCACIVVVACHPKFTVNSLPLVSYHWSVDGYQFWRKRAVFFLQFCERVEAATSSQVMSFLLCAWYDAESLVIHHF